MPITDHVVLSREGLEVAMQVEHLRLLLEAEQGERERLATAREEAEGRVTLLSRQLSGQSSQAPDQARGAQDWEDPGAQLRLEVHRSCALH